MTAAHHYRSCDLLGSIDEDADDCTTHKHTNEVVVTTCGKCGARITQDGIYWSDVNDEFTDGSHQHEPGESPDDNEYTDFLEARIDAQDAANGDSNDAEIECLQMALELAERLLVRHHIFTGEELGHE